MTATNSNREQPSCSASLLTEPRTYRVARAGRAPSLADDWDQGVWRDVEVAPIDQFHPTSNDDDRPRAEAKLLYDDDALYVQFRVHDKYAISSITQRQGNVSRDSCVEFFFQPGEGDTVSEGYFNFEVNCGGTLLAHFQRKYWARRNAKIADAWLDRVGIYHTMPRRIATPWPRPVTWRIGLHVPLALIESCAGPLGARRPAPGVTWSANWYKCCGPMSSDKGHWASWSPIGSTLDFHQPDRFGTLAFE